MKKDKLFTVFMTLGLTSIIKVYHQKFMPKRFKSKLIFFLSFFTFQFQVYKQNTKFSVFFSFFLFINILFFNLKKSVAQHVPDENFANSIRQSCASCIDFSNNLRSDASKLRYLVINNSDITDLTGLEGFIILNIFACYNANITKLPELPSTLELLEINGTKIKGLPKLPDGLKTLHISSNQIENLPALPNNLNRLACSNNPLYCLPTLPMSLGHLFFDDDKILCLPNFVPNLLQIQNQHGIPVKPPICDAGCILPKPTLTHYHQISNNSNFNQRKLLKSNESSYSVCADGSESSIFKFSGGGYDFTQLKVEILGNPDNNSNDGHLYGQLTILSSSTDSLLIKYKHPDHIIGNTDSNVSVFFLKHSVSENIIKSYSLNIYRPPVLIATGLFTDKPSVSTFENELFTSSLYSFNTSDFIHKVIYENATYLSLNINTQAIPNSINTAILALRNKRIAAGKVDLIAHSDGGILSRLYLQGDNYRQDLHKLITINTPHGGSQKANFWSLPLLQDLFCNSPIDPKKCDKGLINDLRVNSELIISTLNGPKINNHITHSHAIATTVLETQLTITEPPTPSEWYDCGTTIAVGSLAGPAGFVAGVLGCGSGFIAGRIKDAAYGAVLDVSNYDIFKSLYNDQIASLSSQLGGLEEFSTTQISNQAHETSLANQKVIQRVIELIKSDVKSNDFSTTGFSPPFLSFLTPSSTKTNIVSNAQIKINKPINSSKYYKGRLLNIDISGNDISEIKIMVGYKSDSVYIIRSTSPNTNFQFPLDTIIGKREMIVIAKTNDGSYIKDSTSFWITDNICEQSDLNSYMYLTGSPASGAYTFNRIASDAKIESFKNITYKTVGYALLLPGFESKGQSVFKTEIQIPCQNVPIPVIAWDKNFGGGTYAEGYAVDVSPDGKNYFIASYISTSCTPAQGNGQIQKLDLNGNQLWSYCLSERLNGEESSILKSTTDGGCIFSEKNATCNKITKLNASGSIIWQKCIPNAYDISINSTNDGGFIVGCNIYISNSSPSFSILKLDNLGNTIWQKNDSDTAVVFISQKITPTQDGGYLVAKSVDARLGYTASDLVVLKLDATGNSLWKKRYNRAVYDYAAEIRATADNGFVLVGSVQPNGITIDGYSGNSDAYIMKLNSAGNTEWLKCFGWAGSDNGKTITVKSDGFLLGGYSSEAIPNELNCSWNYENNSINGGSWVMKIDNSGNKVWQKCIQTNGTLEMLDSMKNTNDGGLILTGKTNSNGGGIWVKKTTISN